MPKGVKWVSVQCCFVYNEELFVSALSIKWRKVDLFDFPWIWFY